MLSEISQTGEDKYDLLCVKPNKTEFIEKNKCRYWEKGKINVVSLPFEPETSSPLFKNISSEQTYKGSLTVFILKCSCEPFSCFGHKSWDKVLYLSLEINGTWWGSLALSSGHTKGDCFWLRLFLEIQGHQYQLWRNRSHRCPRPKILIPSTLSDVQRPVCPQELSVKLISRVRELELD